MYRGVLSGSSHVCVDLAVFGADFHVGFVDVVFWRGRIISKVVEDKTSFFEELFKAED